MNTDASLCLLDERVFDVVDRNGHMKLSCMYVCVCGSFFVNSYSTIFFITFPLTVVYH